jgi:hypothetical protein
VANVSVDFDTLKSNHPSYRTIRSLVTNIPSIVDETCAVQLSYALNRCSGGVIVNYAYPDATVATGKVRGFEGNDKMNYIYSVVDMKVYLSNKYGTPENYKSSKAKVIEKIKGRRGILAMGYRHIDLWDKTDIHRSADYLMDYLWTNESLQVRGVFFWEVTSEWGF